MVPGWSSIQAHIHAPRKLHEQSKTASGTSETDEAHTSLPSTDVTPRPTLSSPPSTSGMASSSSISSVPKSHASPSKASYNRTYDSKLVTREMHRLGVPSPLAPSISSAPSTSSLTLPTPSIIAPTHSQSSSTDPWRSLHVHVLPLFNGEPLRIPIEDLNTLVKRHIQTVVSSSPPRALITLEQDASELIASGMITLNAKLIEIEDEKLMARVVEIWGFFWDNVLTYVEGVLLPLQTDSLLSSLYRPQKVHHRATSPSRQNASQSLLSSSACNVSPTHIDVRSIALTSFRDRVILPLFERLYARLALPNRHDNYHENPAHQQPRLQQMLLVLSSQSTYRPTRLPLKIPAPQPSAGEAAISELLRVVRNPSAQATSKFLSPSNHTRTLSFLSGGLPRDRRGRIAQKRRSKALALSNVKDENLEETPRMENTFKMLQLERDREILESLRSPDIETTERASMGGWGLGEGTVDATTTIEEKEDEPPLDWDQAQAIVERMVGMAAL